MIFWRKVLLHLLMVIRVVSDGGDCDGDSGCGGDGGGGVDGDGDEE